MTATWHWYGPALKHIMDGSLDLDTDTINVTLATSSYTPDLDHEFRSSASTYEPGASGTFVAGGTAVDSKAVSYVSASNRAEFTCADEAWTGATITARTAILYKVVGSAATDILIAYASEASDVISTNGTFTVDMPASGGVLTLTTS